MWIGRLGKLIDKINSPLASTSLDKHGAKTFSDIANGESAIVLYSCSFLCIAVVIRVKMGSFSRITLSHFDSSKPKIFAFPLNVTFEDQIEFQSHLQLLWEISNLVISSLCVLVLRNKNVR